MGNEGCVLVCQLYLTRACAASRGLGRVGPKPGGISGPHVAPGRRAMSRRRTFGTGASRPQHCLRGGDVADEAASEAARSRGTATGSRRLVRRSRRRCQLHQNGCHQPTSGCGAKEQRGEYCEHYAAARVLGRTASPSRRRFVEYEGRGVHERRFLQHVCASLRPAWLRRPSRPLPPTRFLGLWPTCDRRRVQPPGALCWRVTSCIAKKKSDAFATRHSLPVSCGLSPVFPIHSRELSTCD